MMIFGHRGFSTVYPENTLLSFKKAFEVGADGVELDVRLSKDGKIVIFHDDDMKRIFGLEKRIEDLNYDDIEKLSYRGEKVPTLDEVFDVLPDERWVIVEIKGPEAGEPSIGLVKERGLKDRVIFSSFNHELIKDLKSKHPELNFAFLIDESHKDFETVSDYILKTHPHSVHIPKDAFDMDLGTTLKFISVLDKNGIGVILWNTNDIDFVKKYEEMFFGVIVDEVEKFVKWKKG